MINKNELNSTNIIPVEENISISNSNVSLPARGTAPSLLQEGQDTTLLRTPQAPNPKGEGIDADAGKVNITNTVDMIQYLKQVCRIQQPGSLSKSYFYNFNSSNRYKIYKLFSMIFNIINYFFGTFYCIISKPVLLFTQNKLTIYINYYIPKTSYRLIRRHNWKYNKLPANSAKDLTIELEKLIKILSKLLKLNVELQLNRLKYPYHDSSILAKLISFNSNYRKFTPLIKLIFKKASIITNALKTYKNKSINTCTPKECWSTPTDQLKENNIVGEVHSDFYSVVSGPKNLKIHKSIPAVLTGLKIKISGRLITQRVVPKKTISKLEKGGFKKTKTNLVDYATYTNKNKRGSYTVKVWSTSRITL